MTRTFCDLCNVDTTNRQSGYLHGTDDADGDGCGQETHGFDVCLRCYRRVIKAIRSLKTASSRI